MTTQLEPDSRYTTAALIRRLLFEHALTHWRLYALAFVLMAIAAGCTAFTAYLLGDFINQAYLHKNFHNILILGAITIAVFTVRGAALYGQAVLLSRVGNRISAANQKRMFDRLLSQESRLLRRPSFLRVHRTAARRRERRHAGAGAAHSRGRPRFHDARRLDRRDGDAGSAAVHRHADRLSARDVPAAQDGAPHPQHRACAVHRRHAHRRDDAGDLAGPAHRQGLHAGRHDAGALRLQCGRGRARGEQMGARRQPHLAADGNARRLRDRRRDRLWRLPRHPARLDAGRVLLVPRGLPARQRAGQAARAPQSGDQQQPGRRARAVRDHRQPGERAGRRQQAGADGHRRARRIPRRRTSPIVRASRCCAACRSSPSPAR